MSGFILNFDAQLLMLEVLIHKLTVPSSCPFDAVINSKYVVSFSFMCEDDWIDILPQRTDYKTYCGSAGEVQYFEGGKSVVFPLPATEFCEESDGLTVEMHVRREVSPYFEIDAHVMELGKLSVNVDELFNSIVEELRLRRELGDCLQLAHEKDPICKSMRHECILKDPDTDEATDGKLMFWMRLSHLGNNVITEIDMPSRWPCDWFYAQEQTNREEQYELKEIGCNSPPITDPPLYSKVKDCADFVCTCTSEQKLRLMMDMCKSIGISTVSSTVTCTSTCPSDDPDCRDKGVGTRDCQKDKSVGTGSEKPPSDDDDDNGGKKPKKRRGAGQAVMVEKCIPCEPCCIPCCIPCIPCCYDSCTPCTTTCCTSSYYTYCSPESRVC